MKWRITLGKFFTDGEGPLELVLRASQTFDMTKLPVGFAFTLERIATNEEAEVETTVDIDRCPGCGEPAHATESDEDSYHEGCRP